MLTFLHACVLKCPGELVRPRLPADLLVVRALAG
jgi:hypothetical protein